MSAWNSSAIGFWDWPSPRYSVRTSRRERRRTGAPLQPAGSGRSLRARRPRHRLGQYLILSESEADSGGREKTTILADAVEAVLGAVFLDAGFEKARAVVRKLWQEQSDSVPEVTVDAKSQLQEWAQGQGLALPKYTVVSRKGPDHAPHFTAEVLISGKAPAQGEGASKRIAEQDAASAFLMREGVGGKHAND